MLHRYDLDNFLLLKKTSVYPKKKEISARIDPKALDLL